MVFIFAFNIWYHYWFFRCFVKCILFIYLYLGYGWVCVGCIIAYDVQRISKEEALGRVNFVIDCIIVKTIFSVGSMGLIMRKLGLGRDGGLLWSINKLSNKKIISALIQHYLLPVVFITMIKFKLFKHLFP